MIGYVYKSFKRVYDDRLYCQTLAADTRLAHMLQNYSLKVIIRVQKQLNIGFQKK